METNARTYLAAARPVWVVGPTARNGVTLIQRLLNSSGKIMVFGENTSLTEVVPRHVHQACDMHNALHAEAAEARQRFGEGDHSFWSSTLLPDTGILATLAFDYFARMVRCYEQTASQRGCDRWGLKTPIASPDVLQRLIAMMPEAAAVFIYRDPRDVAASAKARKFVTDQAGLTRLAAQWAQNVAAAMDGLLPKTLTLRYESLIEEPSRWLCELEQFTGVSGIDQSVMGQKINTFVGAAERGMSQSGYIPPAELNQSEQSVIVQTAGDTMRRAGYEV